MVKLQESSRLVAFVWLGRPVFLAGGVLMYWLGAVMALWAGATLNIAALVLGQVAVSSIQWMTHYANEYFDLPGDGLNSAPTYWSGGSQILVRELIAPATALRMARLLAIVALLTIAVLALAVRPGLLTAALFGVSLVLSWGYSALPLRLHSRGLGELTVALLVTFLTPVIGFYLQAGRLAWLPVLVALPLACLQFGSMLGVALPDMESDALVGKRTLVVRLGRHGATRLYIGSLLAAYALLPLLVWAGLPLPVATAFCLASPLAAWLGWRLWRGDYELPRLSSGLVFAGIALLMASAALDLAALIVLAWGSDLASALGAK
jgi:1,4-dihydroxy-2-naphthoate octaprenyltransferase